MSRKSQVTFFSKRLNDRARFNHNTTQFHTQKFENADKKVRERKGKKTLSKKGKNLNKESPSGDSLKRSENKSSEKERKAS